MSNLGKKCFECESEGKSGLMMFKEGTSRAGKPYMGWFCQKDKTHVEWLKERPEVSAPPKEPQTEKFDVEVIVEKENYSFPQSYAKDIIVARIEKGFYDEKSNCELALDFAGLIRACVGFIDLTSALAIDKVKDKKKVVEEFGEGEPF